MSKLRLWLILKMQDAIEAWGDDWFLARDIQPLVQKGEQRPITPNRIAQHMRFLRDMNLVEATRTWHNHDDPKIRTYPAMLKYRRRVWGDKWRVKSLISK